MSLGKNIKLVLLAMLTFSACWGDDPKDSRILSTDINTAHTSLVINGYILPPMPDKGINDSTLLGIDSNNNGVRDDIEIWLLEKYKDEHPIYTEIAMQAGRAWQKVLEDPSKSIETSKILNATQFCQFYYQYDAKHFGDSLLVDTSIIDREYRKKVTNTKERETAYFEYDSLLSGSMGILPGASKGKSYCDFNTTKFENIK